MSLSARIVLRPSRRVAACEGVLALGGSIVAIAALIERWPAFSWPLVAFGTSSALALVVAIRRKDRRFAGHALTLSDRDEVGVMPLYDHVPVDEASWRVVEPTMIWSGFAVLGLRAGRGPHLVLPVVGRDLEADDRRALRRFLRWTLRGGAGVKRVAPEAA